MDFNKRNTNEINEEQIAAFLTDALSRLESASESDIEAYKQVKKIFKKTIPFSRRNYLAALLIKNATQGFRSNRFSRDRNDKFSRTEKTERTKRNERLPKTEKTERKPEDRQERAPRVTIDPEAAGTIFVSIGRSRGVYPRDLVGLLVSAAGFDRSRIGEIRVLSNYSFITLFSEDCEKAIKALDGYDYRGRKLSVSYSKKKDETEAAAATEAQDASVQAEAEDTIPANVTNDAHAVPAENIAEQTLAAEQSAFAASMSESPVTEDKPYSETTDDGQVKSHFGSGAAY